MMEGKSRLSCGVTIAALALTGAAGTASAQYGQGAAPVADVAKRASLPLHFSGDLGLGYDSNVSNSQPDEATRDSSFAAGALHATYSHRFSLFTSLLARGSVQGEAYNYFEGLSNGKASAMLRLSHRPDGGFFMPTFATWISAGLWEFDSRIRDSTEYRAGLFLIQPLNTAFNARLSLAALERDSESRVFDLGHWSAGLNLDWTAVPQRLTLYAGYQYQDGDVVSSAAVPGGSAQSLTIPKSSHSFAIVSAADAIEADDAFGGLAAGEFAYRLEAKTHIGTLGFNVPLSRQLSFDAQLQAVQSSAAGEVEYERWLTNASLLVRF